jgi:hypothetical protein
MDTTKISGVVKLTYFDEVVKNKGKSPEVYYDCNGQAVHIGPGKAETVRRVRRELVTNLIPTKEKDSEDGKKQEHSEGENS